MTVDKPDIGEQDWGGTLNTVLDELDAKETIDGSQTKATQAYTSSTEYTDAAINELTIDFDDATSVAQAAATSASASASSAGAASTSAASAAASSSSSASDAASSAAEAENAAATAAAGLATKQDIASLSTDVAAHVADASALDVAVAAKIAAAFVAQVGFNPKNYGALGNGSHNDTAAIASTIAAAEGAISAGVAGAKIVFPAGEYIVDDTSAFTRFSGSIEGQGVGNPPTYTASPGNGTVIRWTGPNTKSMFKLRDYSAVDISGIKFEGNDTTPPTAVIESNSISGDGAGTGSYLRIRGCQLGKSTWSTLGANKGAAAVGVLFSGDNVNNDTFSIKDTQISGCALGVSIPNSQSTWGVLDNVFITGSTSAGVKTSAAILMLNPQFDNCAIDLQADSSAAVTAIGWGSERSGKIIDLTSIGRVTVYGGKWLLGSPMTGSTNRFIEAPLLTGNAGIFVHDVNISTALATHPKLYARGSGGGGASGGFLVVRDCITSMVVGDLDVASTGSNALEIDIRSSNLLVRAKYSTATTLTTAGDAFLDAKADKASNLSDLASASTARTNLSLGNVNNTSDAAKPISTATQTALDTKALIAATTQFATVGGNQSYAIPTGAKRLKIVTVGPGGPGGSGRRGAAGSIRCGGGSGGSGGITEWEIAVSDLSVSTLYVDVSAGGVGGAARTTDDTDGAAGTASTVTSVKTNTSAASFTNTIAQANSGNAGGGGTATAGAAASGGNQSKQFGVAGVAASGSGLVGANGLAGIGGVAGSGGSGGGLTAANAQSAGGLGGYATGRPISVAAGGTAGGGAGGTGTNPPVLGPGLGGGGGGSNASGAGGAGGAGGRGAGGGGGAASVNGSNSGAGGNGGDGYVEITAYF